MLALGDVDGAGETARRYAIVNNGLANWPPLAGGPLESKGTIRVQWCHGAPGIVTSLGALLDEELAGAGGELTWRAGPLAKGAGLCHGTAGNGYAFLTLFERSGDERWLGRARRSPAAIARRALAGGSRHRPIQPLDGRPRDRTLFCRLPRRARRVAAALAPRAQQDREGRDHDERDPNGIDPGLQLTWPSLIT